MARKMLARNNRNFAQFEASAGRIADMLKAAGNQRRLMVLCKLVRLGRANVTQLCAAVGLSQSALSQHLAVLRDEGLVAFDREGQTLWYRIADARTETLLSTLYDLYCATEVAV